MIAIILALATAQAAPPPTARPTPQPPSTVATCTGYSPASRDAHGRHHAETMGTCAWIDDARTNARIDALWHALNTRLLTDAELTEALDLGSRINIPPGVPYFPQDKARERDEAWRQQMRRQEIDRLRHCRIEPPVMDSDE